MHHSVDARRSWGPYVCSRAGQDARMAPQTMVTIKHFVASSAIAGVLGLAAIGGVALTVAAPANAAPSTSGSTSASGTASTAGSSSTSSSDSTSGTSSTASAGHQSGSSSPSGGSTTSSLLTAGSDEVSQSVAGMFAAHGQQYQALSAQAATFHEQSVRCLTVCK
jgi:hypothetical protein